MTPFIKKSEAERLRAAGEGSRQYELYRELYDRCIKNTRQDKWVQDGDTQLWFHLAWERMSDAAFIWAMEHEESVGKWIYNRIKELMTQDDDTWVGPDFRANFRLKTFADPIGTLETGHMTLALCEAFANAPDLFTKDELAKIRNKLESIAIPLCRRFLEATISGNFNAHYGNWTTCLANACGVASMLVDDEEDANFALDFSDMFCEEFSENDFGETLQYSNYALLHLSHLYEVAIRLSFKNPEELNIKCLSNLMPWYAESLLYVKHIDSVGIAPRSVNFGDSAAIFRPSGDVLTQVAIRMKEASLKNAGLARWLFDMTYTKDIKLPDELATFGFVNQFEYFTVLMVPDMCKAMTPKEAELPLVAKFATGEIICRDSWDDTRSVVAMQAGFDASKPVSIKAGHRHADQNSFTVTVGKERLLSDPGHCNYRSNAFEFSRLDCAHSNVKIYDHERLLEQHPTGGTMMLIRLLGNQLTCDRQIGNVRIVASDSAMQYEGGHFMEYEKRCAMRVWVMRLPNIMLVLDYVSFEGRDISLGASFVINTRDNKTLIEREGDTKLTISRGGEAMSIFCDGAVTDKKKYPSTLNFSLGFMHDFYHPLANQICQGRDGSSHIFEWKSTGAGINNHAIYAMAMDKKENIVKWESYTTADGFTGVKNSETGEMLEISFNGGALMFRDENGEKCISTRLGEKFDKVSKRKYYRD